MRWGRAVVAVVFYGAASLVLLLVVTNTLRDVLPDGMAAHVGRNSEGILLAIAVCLWLELGRPRALAARNPWRVALPWAAGAALAGGLLLASGFDNRIRTLNEGCAGIAFVVLYTATRRPIPRWVPVAITAGAVLLPLTLGWTDPIVRAAEVLAVVALTPLAFDLATPDLLDPAAEVSNLRRIGWLSFLVAFPIVAAVLEDGGGVVGSVGSYANRTTEAFLFVLLTTAYLLVARRLDRVPREHALEETVVFGSE